jgi:2-phospho-L-lactate guanylyltransferase
MSRYKEPDIHTENMQKPMIYRALIPVKTLYEAKSRLAPHLSQVRRANLVLKMLGHVVSVLQTSAELEDVIVVSPDPVVLKHAQSWGARAMLEEQPGHNPALSAAASKELATGASALLTLSADLPLLQERDIYKMIVKSRHYDVVLAPSRDGTGTNALLVRPPLVLPYLFGPGSLQRYQAEAQERHLRTTFYHSIGLALDIDTLDDLETYRRCQCSPRERGGEHSPSLTSLGT